MTQIKGEIALRIEAPAQAIYDYLLNFTRHPEWSRNLSRVWQVSEGPVGVGTIFRAQEGPPPVPLAKKLLMMVFFMAGVASGAKTYSQAQITGLEPGRRIAWQAGVPKGEHYFNLAHWEINLEPQGQATHLTQRFEYLPQTEAAERMVGAAGPGGLEKACAISLTQLKTVLEQRAVQAGNETPNPKSQYAS